MKALKKIYLGLMLIFLYLPIIVLIVFSFNESRSRAVWGGFSLKWYSSLLQEPQILEALSNTLSIAIIASLAATVIGTAAAFGIDKMNKLPKRIMMNLNNIPVLNPDIVTGISLMILFIFARSVLGIGSLGYGTLLLAHITFCIPYVVLSVLPKIRQLDKNLYEAALDLGATPFQAFTKVILPELYTAILTGAIFAFTLSLDDFVVSLFTTGKGVSNLSILIYSSAAKRGVNPQINALSTIMFIIIMTLLFLVNRRGKNNTLIGDGTIENE